MLEHHQRAINKLTDQFKNDMAFPAMIVGGSVAKGKCRPDSDIDVFMIASEEEYMKRIGDKNLHYHIDDICDYPGGYVDGKVIDYQFILDVHENGSEVARSAFLEAIVAYSHIDGIDDIIAEITKYPQDEKIEKLASFYAQFEAARWYIGEAFRREDTYLLLRNITNLLLFGIRMILAHNEMLYCYHKFLMTDLKNAPRKPKNVIKMTEKLLAEPTKENAEEFYNCIMSFTDWPKPSEGWCSRFTVDTEWNWRTKETPIEDR